MSKKMMMYIDSNNFYKNIQSLYNNCKIHIDWRKMILGIRDVIQEDIDCKFCLAFYYSALSEREDNPLKYDNHKCFLDSLNKCKYINVIIGKLSRIPRTEGVPINKNDPSTYRHIEKTTDNNVSNGMLLSTADIIVLLSADTDYENTIKILQHKNKKVLVVVPIGAKSSKIQSIVGDENVVLLDKTFFDKYVDSESQNNEIKTLVGAVSAINTTNTE